MSNSKHMQARAAIVALLTAAPDFAGIGIVANRRRPMPIAVDRQVFVYLEDAIPTRGAIAAAPFDWSTRIRIECVARDTAGANADINSDAMQTAAYAALLANPTLSNTVFDIEPKGIAWTEDEADVTVSACQGIYTVWHETRNNVLTA